ncbi:MAG: disulfide bond formation protein B [Coxiellaceae bacterium]|nr:disulfide bond formation protein B [Coxiellaceae bacterium]
MEESTRIGFYKAYNIIELLLVLLVLCLAVGFQFILRELPCPLCLLQRLGLLGVAFALILNLRYGPKPIHYGLSLLAALFSAFVALRQIALHIVPGSGSYGSQFLGFHLYTWSFIASMAVVLFNAVVLCINQQYFLSRHLFETKWRGLTHLLFAVVLCFSFFLCVTVFLECGIRQCPENPTHYIYAKQDPTTRSLW